MMTGIIAIVLICAALMTYTYTSELSATLSLKKKSGKNATYIICTIAFIVRMIFAMTYPGHATDINCFNGWSDIIYSEGISNFYTSDGFHDYPPGYMYILYVIGSIKAWLSPSENFTWLLLKLPAIICDIATGILIYNISAKFNDKSRLSALILILYVLNPTVILNSSIWGQVDSIFTFFVLLMLYMLSEKRLIVSYFLFALCIFIKPQALMFFPLLAFAIIENVFLYDFNIKCFVKNLIFGLLAICSIFILSIPFGIKNVIEQYTTTLESYPYLTVNAFNIWGALGKNWVSITPVTTFIGYTFILVIVIYATVIFFKSKNSCRYYIIGAALSFMTFMLSVKMHDRYAFPTIALLISAFAVNRCKKTYLLYALTTLSQLFNTAWVLFVYETDINKYYNSPVINVASIINIAIMAFLIFYLSKEHVNSKENKETIGNKSNDTTKPIFVNVATTEKYPKLSKFDYIFVAAMVLVYSCIAFYNLGDTKAPQTSANITNIPYLIDIGSEVKPSSISMYLGSYNIDESRTLSIEYLDSNKNILASNKEVSGAVFCWNDYPLPADLDVGQVRYISISAPEQNIVIYELGIKDTNGELIIPKGMEYTEALFDEQTLVPDRTTNLNSTYFDEIYHARTAYELTHKLDVYEWTHPPFGKFLISIGIKMFGMTPFGWRFIGTLFGVLMLPVIYIFAKRITKKSIFAAISCVIFTFDFMHFVQTRIATIDVYVTFFIMLMYLFMYRYYKMSFYDTTLKKTFIPLGLSGICMGLGVASKWTGAYAGIGLAVIFFITMYARYREYRYAQNSPDAITNGISHEHIINCFVPNIRKTIIFCLIFFVAIPITIYLVSYIPYLRTPDMDGISAILKNQVDMFRYHSETVVNSTHPFSSRWYEWLLMKRPIFYYSGTVSENIREGISAFGNPAVWWTGIIAFFYMVYISIQHRDKTALFIVLSYLAQLVSWIPITRTTYIYHYFPSVPFVVLMIGYGLYSVYSTSKNKNTVIIGSIIYTAITVGLFVLFYPVLSGMPCDVYFAQTWLKWFDSWVLL